MADFELEQVQKIVADYQVEFEATEDLARRSIADAEDFFPGHGKSWPRP